MRGTKVQITSVLWMSLMLVACSSLGTGVTATDERGETPLSATSTRAVVPRTVAPASATVRPTSSPTTPVPILPGPVVARENAMRVAQLGGISALAEAQDIADIDWSPDGQDIAVVVDGEAQIFEVPSLARIATIRVIEDGLHLWMWSLDFSPEGDVVLVGGMGFARQWNWREGEPRGFPDRLGTESFDVEYSPDGRWIASGSPDGAFVRAADGSDSLRILREDSYTYFTRWIGFSPDGRVLAAVVDDGYLRAWEPGTWSLAWQRELWPGGAGDLAYSPDGLLLTTGSSGDLLPLISSETGEDTESLTLEGTNGVIAAAFSPNGEVLVLGTVEGRIALWDLATLRMLVELEGHTDSVERIVFSPDGRLFASIGYDDMVRFWGIPAGQ